MQNAISRLSDLELLNHTQRLAAEERKLTLDVLWHLKEIEFRRLYSAGGFSSLFDYAVKELHYSEAAASRRIAAMRLLKSVPEVANSIENGSLNLSTVSSVQVFLKREEREQGRTYSLDQKKVLLQSLENKSKRECEKVLLELSPSSAIPADRQKAITATETEVRIVVKDETLKKMERLRELLSHRNPEGSMGHLLGIMAEIVLDKVDPERISDRAELRAQRLSAKPRTQSNLAQPGSHQVTTPPPAPATPPAGFGGSYSESESGIRDGLSHPQEISLNTSDHTRSPEIPSFREPISAPLKRQVMKRDQYRCIFTDPTTGRRCGSRFLLEADHLVPVAHGGRTELSNLRTLCKNHNLYEAVRKLGREKMAPFLKS